MYAVIGEFEIGQGAFVLMILALLAKRERERESI